MGKGKKGGKRMNKKQVAEALTSLFQSHPNVELSFKQIFKTLHFDTHPLKMLAIEVMEEMAWDDFLRARPLPRPTNSISRGRCRKASSDVRQMARTASYQTMAESRHSSRSATPCSPSMVTG